MDEVFGENNFCADIVYQKTVYSTSEELPTVHDYILWYARNRRSVKYRQLFHMLDSDRIESSFRYFYVDSLAGPKGGVSMVKHFSKNRLFRFMSDNITSPGSSSYDDSFIFNGEVYQPGKALHWKTNVAGMARLAKAGRIFRAENSLRYCKLPADATALPMKNIWTDTTVGSFAEAKTYVVQTTPKVIERCILMAKDPGDLVLDPTCGSGTTAHVAEQWGRRWITIDTSRVALALARARIMGARYPFYLLADSREGQLKDAEVTRTAPSSQPVGGNIRHGFVYERVPHIMLSSIANNTEIDVIWDQWQAKLEPLREALNAALKKSWQEWEVPRDAENLWDGNTQEIFYRLKAERELGEKGSSAKIAERLQAINHNLKRNYTLKTLPERPVDPWPEVPTRLHADWWQARIARQQEIDKSIAAKAEFEYVYDKPYPDPKKVRVAGPFTVESLSPHRALGVDENDELIDGMNKDGVEYGRSSPSPRWSWKISRLPACSRRTRRVGLPSLC
jgi:adenine-specific DNA-methyltransferase